MSARQSRTIGSSGHDGIKRKKLQMIWQFCRFLVVSFVGVGFSASNPSVQADLILDEFGVEARVDFQDYAGAGLEPGGANGRLDSDSWTVFLGSDGETQETALGASVGAGLFGRGISSGGLSEAGTYAFETGDGNRALGFQMGGIEFSNSVLSLRIRNETDEVVDQLRVTYDVWVLNDSEGTDYFDLEFSDGTNWFDPVLFETAAEADEPADWKKYEQEYDLFLPKFSPYTEGFIDALNPGDDLVIQWSIGGSYEEPNGYDEVALDNVRVTAVPEPASLSLLLIVLAFGFAWRRKRDGS